MTKTSEPLDVLKDKLRRDLVFSRDGWRCRICHSRENLHCHHIIFRSQGGEDTTANLLTVCSACHTATHERKLLILPFMDNEHIDADTKEICYEFKGYIPGKT